jgi:hypothetical protein
MVKILPNYHHGVEFIQLAQLPPDDARTLSNWLPNNSKFRLNLEDVELDECVYYSEYESWFNTVNFEKRVTSSF